MLLERRSFALQKTVNCTLKGGLLQAKRRPFAEALIIRRLRRDGRALWRRWQCASVEAAAWIANK